MTSDKALLAKLGIETPVQLTADELKQLSPELIVRAREQGQLNDLMKGANS